jgi:hypothetical protein
LRRSNEEELDGCSMWLQREMKIIHRILVGNLKKGTPLDDVGIGGRITLK